MSLITARLTPNHIQSYFATMSATVENLKTQLKQQTAIANARNLMEVCRVHLVQAPAR